MDSRLLGCLAALTIPVHAAIAVDSSLKAYQQQLLPTINRASELARSGKPAESLATLKPIIDSRHFTPMPASGKQIIYNLAAFGAGRSGQSDLAYRYALAATDLPDAAVQQWQGRLWNEISTDRPEAAVVTAERMVLARVEALNATPIRYLFELQSLLERQKKADLLGRLLKALADPAYEPDEPGGNKDRFRYDYARILVAAGNSAAAIDLVRQIQRPDLLMRVRLDRRLTAGLPAGFDAAASFERQLQRDRDAAASHPGSLRLVLAMTRSLRILGRPSEAMAVLDANKPVQEATAAEKRALDYADLAEQFNWWWNERALAYNALGKFKEAAEAFRGGAKLKEGGDVNVSQIINLAGLQITFGENADALATLNQLDEKSKAVSPYGVMQLRQIRGCAHAQLKDVRAAREDLAYLLAHRSDAPGAIYPLQLCLGDLDGAAAAMIARLDDPEDRVEALFDLSDFAPPPVALPPDPFATGVAALKARSDVRAAIERAGGNARFNVQNAS